MVERRDPSRFLVLGGKPGDSERAADMDFLIRSGMCPNGCGLMLEGDDGQHCEKCNFMCNSFPDKQASN
jgi:hypothetical protein